MPIRNNKRRPASRTLAIGFLSAGAIVLALGGITYQRAEAQGSSGGDWLTYGGSYSGDRFSPLGQITASNVRHLAQLCMYDTGENTRFQTGPISVGGVFIFHNRDENVRSRRGNMRNQVDS
jgi:alcohol dehydrogenase (cytochrome c)